MCIPAHCVPLVCHFVHHSTKSITPPYRVEAQRPLAALLVPRKPHWPISAEEDGPFPVELCLAPTVVESNVPERTRRRGEYGARVSGREITVSFLPPLHSNNKNEPNLNFRGVYTVFCLQGGGKRGIGAASFFLFRFFSLFLKRGFCVSRWFVSRSRRKDDGRRGRSEGATEAESRLFNAIVKREEAYDQFAKSLRHLHTSREASGRRWVSVWWRLWGEDPGDVEGGNRSVTTAQSGASLGIPAADRQRAPKASATPWFFP